MEPIKEAASSWIYGWFYGIKWSDSTYILNEYQYFVIELWYAICECVAEIERCYDKTVIG